MIETLIIKNLFHVRFLFYSRFPQDGIQLILCARD